MPESNEPPVERRVFIDADTGAQRVMEIAAYDQALGQQLSERHVRITDESIRELAAKYPAQEIPRIDSSGPSVVQRLRNQQTDEQLAGEMVKALLCGFASSGDFDELDITDEGEVVGFARGLWKFARIVARERHAEKQEG